MGDRDHAPRLYDISRTLSPTTAVWPGDSPLQVEHVLRLDEGHAVNLTTLTLSPHTGSHADAPYHFTAGGPCPHDLPLEPYIGPARLVTVDRREGGIQPQDLGAPDLAGVQRLLIRTWVSDVPDDRWPDHFPYPTPELIAWLSESGVILLGVDMPSVDRFDSQELPCHHLLWQHGILHLENLRLVGMPDGIYELVALPLKLAAGCGSPVRAILRELPGHIGR